MITAVLGLLFEDAILGGRTGWLGKAVHQAPVAALWAAIACLAAAFGWRPRLPRLRLLRAAIGGWLTRGIPIVDARTVAVFRVVFGIALWFALREHEIGRPPVRLVTELAIVAFTIGLLARAALIVAAGGVLGWMLLWTRDFGHHPVATIVLALPCLCVGRWSDAWSVDAWLRPRAPRGAAAAYGFAVWMPTLVIGVALLAAAVAKLSEDGWIANGTVKFAFVTDYERAAVPWGLWIASHPIAAVAASAAAITVEALAIAVVFIRSWRWRLAAGFAIAGLFAGFYLLQGELWWGWWLLFLGYLPWELLNGDAGRPLGVAAGRGPALGEQLARRLTWPQIAAIVLLLALQLVASTARLEIPPAISAFDMYSTTFPSTEAFERSNPNFEYRFETETDDGVWVDVTDCFEGPGSPAEATALAADRPRLDRELARCSVTSVRRRGRLRLFESLRRFDWESGVFRWVYRDRERWTQPAP